MMRSEICAAIIGPVNACIADINAHHQDAAMCFITGDLAHA